MASTNVITDIESKNKATRHFNFSGIVFLVAVVGLSFMFKDYVNSLLQIPFVAFNFLCGAYVMLPSRVNKGRNNLESIFVMLRKDLEVYRQYIPKDEA